MNWVVILAGGSGTNILVFTFTPAAELAPTGRCSIRFSEMIAAEPTPDFTPTRIEEPSRIIGTCDNGLTPDAGLTKGFVYADGREPSSGEHTAPRAGAQ